MPNFKRFFTKIFSSLLFLLTTANVGAVAAGTVGSAAPSSCETVMFTHYLNGDYTISVDDRELMRSFLSLDYNVSGRGQQWSLFEAYGTILPGSKPIFYVSLADNERRVWGIEFFGSFWFQAELVPLDYTPWSIVEARPVDGLSDVVTLHSPAAEEKVQQPVCLLPSNVFFHRTPGVDVLRFQACSVHPKEWGYWVPRDAKTHANCARAILTKSNYHARVTVDPHSLCNSVFLKPFLSDHVFLSGKSDPSSQSYLFLDTRNMFDFKQVWIPRVDFLPSSRSLFVNLIWGQDKDLAVTFSDASKLIPAHLTLSSFSGSSHQAWSIVASRAIPGSFAIIDSSGYDAITVDRDLKVGEPLSAEPFSDEARQLWRAISTQTGTDCTSIFIDSFSGMSIGNIVSDKTNRSAVPVIKEKSVTLDWQAGTGGSDVYYTILHKDLSSPADDFAKQLHYASDPSKCFIPTFSPSGQLPQLSLVNCIQEGDAASVWRFGGLRDLEKDKSQFCVSDTDRVWCLADVKGSFAEPKDEAGQQNPDTVMRFDARMTGIPTVFTSGNGFCLSVYEKPQDKNFVTMSCHMQIGGYSIGGFRLIPSEDSAASPQKKYFISLVAPDKTVLCYGDRNGVLSFDSCKNFKDPALQWVILSHGHIKNVKEDVCLSAPNDGQGVPVIAVSCSIEGPQMVFFTPSYSGVGDPNVFMQLHHWDLKRWTDDGLCVTAMGDTQNNAQQPCLDPRTDEGKHQLWWREFLRSTFSQGELVSAVNYDWVLSMAGGYVLAHQIVYKWGGWSVQKFIMYDTYQTASTDSVGIVYCYSDGTPGVASKDNIVADFCKEDGSFGINNQTWLFTPVVLPT